MFWVYVSVAIVIQHARRVRRMILSLACPAVPYFSTLDLSHKRHDFREKLFNVKCGFWFSLRLLSETLLILSRSERDIIINVHRSLRKGPVTLVRLWSNWIFSSDLKKKKLKFHENLSGGSRFLPRGRTDGRTDRDTTKLIVFFSQFCERAEKPAGLDSSNQPKALFSGIVYIKQFLPARGVVLLYCSRNKSFILRVIGNT
jgi:hypothetical protein